MLNFRLGEKLEREYDFIKRGIDKIVEKYTINCL